MTKKNNPRQEDLRKRVYKFADLHHNWSKSAIAKHFMLEKVARSTIFCILQRKQRELAAERKVGSGRPAIKMNKNNIKRLERRIDHLDGISQQYLTTHFDVSQPHISRVINIKTSIR